MDIGKRGRAKTMLRLRQVRLKPELFELLTQERFAQVESSTVLPARSGKAVPLPGDLHLQLTDALAAQGIRRLWTHQAECWETAHREGHFMVTTGTASGKSLCFNLPVLDGLLRDPRATAIYLYPTKALAQDQLRRMRLLAGKPVEIFAYDGDTPTETRLLARQKARVLLTNPDMLHLSVLPRHERWDEFLYNLKYVVIDEGLALPIPEGLSFEQAAGVGEVFLTAYQALFWICRMQPGDNVLIHAGASGVGTAATQLAKLAGGRVLVTASSAHKLDFCRSLGADVGINYKQEDFPTRVMEATAKHGADVLVDFVGTSYFQRNLASLAMDARMVILAFVGGTKAEPIDLRPLQGRRATVTGSTLRSRTLDYRVKLTQEFSEKFLPKFATGELKPVIDTVLPWSEVKAAHERIEANLNIGKIVLRVS